MIILPNHFCSKDTIVVMDMIINGCQIFHQSELDQKCIEFGVSNKQKQQVLDALEQGPRTLDVNTQYPHPVYFAALKSPLITPELFVHCVNELIALSLDTIATHAHIRARARARARNWLSTVPFLESVPQSVLMDLAKHPAHQVRRAVAESPVVVPEILDILATDTHRVVRWSVARSQFVTSELLNKLSKDEDISVRMQVVESSTVTIEILRALVSDPAWEVREAIVKSPLVTTELINKLSADPNKWVQLAMVESPIVSDETINNFVLNTTCLVRDRLRILKKHKSKITQSTWHKLTTDSNIQLKRVANIQLPY